MDHGIVGITNGIDDPRRMIRIVSEAGADAVMINTGMIKNCHREIAGKIGLVATIEYEEDNIESALAMGADAVKTTYFGGVPLDEVKKNQISKIAQKCNDWGMPFMAELVPTDPSGKTLYDEDLIKKSARICAELGADIVKTAYPGSPDMFRRAVESCPVPIVIAGGPKLNTDKELLMMVKESVEAGGAGVAIGRNVWQHKDPGKMTRAITGIIHHGSSIDKALKILK
ncbi:class I fructose-bisphosphate aldolase [[Eubacterium] cellulosolvens]